MMRDPKILAGLVLLALSLAPDLGAQSLEVLNDKRQISLRGAGQTLLVRVVSGPVEAMTVTVLDIGGGVVPPGGVQFEPPPGPYDQGRIVAIPIVIERTLFTGTSLDLIGRIDARAAGKDLPPVPFTLSIAGGEIQLQPAATPVTLSLQRKFPFFSVHGQHCVSLKATPAAPLSMPTVQRTELYAGPEGAKAVLQGSFAEARFAPCPDGASSNATPSSPVLVVDSVLSFGVTAASGTLRFAGADVKPDAAIALNVVSKDLLIYPVLVIILASSLSHWIHAWVESGRAERINLAVMAELADDLYNARMIQPGIEQRPEFQQVKQLLGDAARLHNRSDISGAMGILERARQQLDALVSAPPLGRRPLETTAPGGPFVAVETQSGDLTTGRVVTFAIGGDIPDNAVIRWRVRRDGGWTDLEYTADPAADPPGRRVTTRTPFASPGLYAVTAVIDGREAAPASFRVVRAQGDTLLGDVRRRDRLITGLAFVITSLISSVTIADLASFGSFKDYVLQFAGAFGVTEGVKSVSQVLASIRKG